MPVYLGDAEHFKTLIPHPKAVIFVSDFPDLSALIQYLRYLLSNETAYEEHRVWHKDFNQTREAFLQSHPLLRTSWQCRVCEWAAEQYRAKQKGSPNKISNRQCEKEALKDGTLYRCQGQKAIYVVKNGELHLIPDFSTFLALGYDVKNIIVLPTYEFGKLRIGDGLPHAG